MKMQILVTNDDGIHAPGIKVLAAELADLGQVIVIAPDRDRSAVSGALTLSVPLRVKTIQPNWFSVEGTPVDCVHLALNGLLPKLPDMIVSGINEGVNVGENVFYSGTVSAAMEGCYLGVASVAISLDKTKQDLMHYPSAAKVAKHFVQILKDRPLSETVLNVNVPNVPFSELQGIDVVRLGRRDFPAKIEKMLDPRGKEIFWIGPSVGCQVTTAGTDFDAIQNSKVSVTPLNLDLTHHQKISQISSWLEPMALNR